MDSSWIVPWIVGWSWLDGCPIPPRFYQFEFCFCFGSFFVTLFYITMTSITWLGVCNGQSVWPETARLQVKGFICHKDFRSFPLYMIHLQGYYFNISASWTFICKKNAAIPMLIPQAGSWTMHQQERGQVWIRCRRDFGIDFLHFPPVVSYEVFQVPCALDTDPKSLPCQGSFLLKRKKKVFVLMYWQFLDEIQGLIKKSLPCSSSDSA